RHPAAAQLAERAGLVSEPCARIVRVRKAPEMTEFNTSPALTLLPAVDVADGKAVRLTQGEAGTETNFGDPVDAAQEWADQGAEWIHLVDLDAAFGRGDNHAVIKKVIKNTPRRVNIELSGGIRDDASLEAALATGAKRINLGTAALENPEWAAHVIAEYGEAIAVGLDVRGTTLAARGWTKEGGDLWTVLARLEDAGCARYVVTDVTKDGTLKGPNLELLTQVMARTPKPVIASGGVASLDDIAALRPLVPQGLERPRVGKALYARAFTPAAASDLARHSAARQRTASGARAARRQRRHPVRGAPLPGEPGGLRRRLGPRGGHRRHPAPARGGARHPGGRGRAASRAPAPAAHDGRG